MFDLVKECVKIALHNMKSNILRTSLSLLGIMIGVASLVAILSLGGAATENVTSKFAEGGLDIITVYPRRGRSSTDLFNDEFSATLKSTFKNIDDVIVTSSSSSSVRYSNENYPSASVVGTYSSFSAFYSLKFTEGSFFTLEDDITSSQVCVIGKEVYDEIFNSDDAVDKYIKIVTRGGVKSFRVVGVLDKKDPTSSISFDTSVFIPYNTYSDRVIKSNTVGTYIIRAAKDTDPSVVSSEIEEYLNSLVSSDGYRIYSLSQMQDIVKTSMGTYKILLAFIGAISLLVGGVGIMNIMLVSVAERTREIGTLKALGASANVIELQFLIESALLTFIGGILGILLGSLLSVAVSFARSWPIFISLPSVFVGLFFSIVIGIFSGVYPAHRAANLSPIDALNRD